MKTTRLISGLLFKLFTRYGNIFRACGTVVLTFLVGVFGVLSSYPVRWHLICLVGFSLYQSVTTAFVRLSRIKNQDRQCVYLLMLGRRVAKQQQQVPGNEYQATWYRLRIIMHDQKSN